MSRNTPASYRKDIRFPTVVWDLIKNEDNVSKFVIEAVKEKLNKEKKDA